MQKFDILNVFYEDHRLDDSGRTRMNDIKKELEIIWRKEEVALWQRSRFRGIEDGDKNKAYFHTLANHRHRKNHLAELNGPDGPVTNTEDLLDVATTFYKKLFSYEQKPDIHLDDGFWDEGDMITEEEKEILEKPFSEEEIKKAIMSSYAGGGPGPDGLSFIFYQTFWELIKDDFMWLVKDFENGNLDVSRLNFAIITLIPKVNDAKDMKIF